MVLQLALLTDAPTVSKSLIPPVPKPVESDIMAKNFWSFGNGTCAWNVPWPFVTLELGIENVLGVPKRGARTSSKGALPPVHEIGKLSHCVGVPKSNVKLAA